MLNVRSGPGVEYDPTVGQLSKDDNVALDGYNYAKDGSVWWQITSSSGLSGWVHSEFVEESGGVDAVQEAPKPPTPVPPIASNRGDLSPGQNGWTYQYERGRNSGDFATLTDRRLYQGIDCFVSPREDYVRLCQNGEIHPGQESRIAYRWDSSYDGAATISVHAHKIDTGCGDGVWVGTYLSERGQPPNKIGEFAVGGSDNRGETKNYSVHLSRNQYMLTIVDIRSIATCDQTRLYIDIQAR